MVYSGAARRHAGEDDLTSPSTQATCPGCRASVASDARFCVVCGAALASTEPSRHDRSAGMPPPDSPSASGFLGRVVAGRYRILSKLGEGGMGAVYRAEQISLKRTVALKVLRPELSAEPGLVRRFNAEAELAAKLNHPNTVTLYDFGQDSDGSLFIAMEFLEGRSLRDLLHREGPLAPARAVAICEQVCASRADAHARGIVHRDLKPDNVMLVQVGRHTDVVRVLDFGIAKLREDQGDITAMPMTRAGDLLGTPQYMAPEQIRGETVDARTDVYAMGAMLYEMVTGRLPFEGPSLMAILSKHLTEMPARPQARRPDLAIPPALEQLVMDALQKAPAARPPTMEALAERLAALGLGVPGVPSPAPGLGAGVRSGSPVSGFPLHNSPPPGVPLLRTPIPGGLPSPPPGTGPARGYQPGYPPPSGDHGRGHGPGAGAGPHGPGHHHPAGHHAPGGHGPGGHAPGSHAPGGREPAYGSSPVVAAGPRTGGGGRGALVAVLAILVVAAGGAAVLVAANRGGGSGETAAASAGDPAGEQPAAAGEIPAAAAPGSSSVITDFSVTPERPLYGPDVVTPSVPAPSTSTATPAPARPAPAPAAPAPAPAPTPAGPGVWQGGWVTVSGGAIRLDIPAGFAVTRVGGMMDQFAGDCGGAPCIIRAVSFPGDPDMGADDLEEIVDELPDGMGMIGKPSTARISGRTCLLVATEVPAEGLRAQMAVCPGDPAIMMSVLARPADFARTASFRKKFFARRVKL